MRYFLLVLLPLILLPSVAVGATNEIAIKEWPVPWDHTRPRDPSVDPQGRVWFCGQRGNYIAYLEPETGTFKRYAMPDGTFPHNLVAAEDGMVWYAGNGDAYIGRLDPDDGDITRYPMPEGTARDPHTLVFSDDGDLWFTSQMSNYIGRLNTASGEIELVKVPTPGARPYGIKLDSRGRPWVALFGTHKLAMVDPKVMSIEEIALPNRQGRPRRLEVTADDTVWFVDYARGRLLSFKPGTREFAQWDLPGGRNSQPYGTAADDQGRLWIAETGVMPNRLVGFDPDSEEFFSITDIPSGGGTIRHMYFHLPTGTIWFGTDANTIGRARIH